MTFRRRGSSDPFEVVSGQELLDLLDAL